MRRKPAKTADGTLHPESARETHSPARSGPRTAVLWVTHVWSPEIQAEFENLRALQGRDGMDVWLLLDAKTPGAQSVARGYARCQLFEWDALFRLPYPHVGALGHIGHAHFPLLAFYLSHPDYDRYWAIEYDVRYTGKWEDFFRLHREADHDFITCHLRRRREEPRWTWWDSLQHPTETVAPDACLRSLNVVYRLSGRALRFIDAAHRSGWRGHPEALLPTLLLRGGFSLLDLGGRGDFTPPGRRNRLYTSQGLRNGSLSLFGTVRFRPARARPGRRTGKIYHPVKPMELLEPAAARRRMFREWLGWIWRDYVAARRP